MGNELTSSTLRIDKFLGLNTKLSDTAIDFRESSGLQNVNITDDGLEQRQGSAKLNTVAFKEKTDTTAKPINGAYSTKLGGNLLQVAVGGDAFKQFTAGNFTDKTGAVTITDDDDNLASFATFFDGASNEIIIAAFEQDAPIKWTGTGDAADLATPPGNFKFPTVHKNKLWVALGDFVYYSGLLDGESWDLVNDLQRFPGDGEDITGLAVYMDRLIVFKPSSIYMISGSSYRNLFVQEIVTGEGCLSGYSIQEVESRRYGNILVFLSNEGIIKGFNGSKNLITIGDPAKPLFDTMNRSKAEFTTSDKLEDKNQYWLSMFSGSQSTKSQIMVYDYFNDTYADSTTGRPLSSILYHVGINANCLATFKTTAQIEILVSGDYNGFLLRQNIGLKDEETTQIDSKWQTGKMDLGDSETIKLLTDLSTVTTQSSATQLALSITTQRFTGTGQVDIPTSGGLWGTLVWGTDLWSATNTKYTRFQLTNSVDERAISGRWFLAQINHSAANEAMEVNELIISATGLGKQSQYVEN